jgi:hypothetical protein
MTRRILATLAFAALALPATASAQGATLRSCGNTESDGVLIGDITTKRVKCGTARRVARLTVEACGNEGASSCRVRGFSCLVARAAPELRFARCSKPQSGEELFRVIRFDYGS